MYSDKTYRGFSVSGHAGYENAGKDIICASVSALVINTVNAVDALTENVCMRAGFIRKHKIQIFIGQR